MTDGPQYWAVVPAAGSGSRMQSDVPKQYLELNNRKVLSHTLSVLLDCGKIQAVVVAVSEDDTFWPELEESKNPRVHTIIGGESRAESVFNALRYLATVADKADHVLVHDAARPCLRPESLEKLILVIENEDIPGGLLAVPAHDTMKRADENTQVLHTVDRSDLWHAQTPQCFKLDQLTLAIEEGFRSGVTITDEASAMEAQGYKPLLVEGRSDNIKITRPSDLALAAFFLSRQEEK